MLKVNKKGVLTYPHLIPIDKRDSQPTIMVEAIQAASQGRAGPAAEPEKIWQVHPKLTIVLNFINKDSQVNQLMVKAFEEVYRRNSKSLRVLI